MNRLLISTAAGALALALSGLAMAQAPQKVRLQLANAFPNNLTLLGEGATKLATLVGHIPCGIIPPEASGWFRKEIRSVQDLEGLKMRFFGLGAKVMAKLGVATQLLAAGDIFQALQLGTIDATEFSVPSADQKFAFYQVAKFYYFPGWHQQATFNELYVNKKKWDSLSDQHKEIIEELTAEGSGTLKTMNVENTTGDAEWKNGEWTVVFRRPLRVDDAGSVRFAPGEKMPVAFAVWEGSHKESAGRKAVSPAWAEVRLEP